MGEGFNAERFNVNNPIMTPEEPAAPTPEVRGTSASAEKRAKMAAAAARSPRVRRSGIDSDLFNVASDVLAEFSGSPAARHVAKGRASNALFP